MSCGMQKVEFGVNTAYQSDYDLMIIVPKSKMKYTEDRLGSKATPKYHKIFARRRHASPQFIIERYLQTQQRARKKPVFLHRYREKGYQDIRNQGVSVSQTPRIIL